MEGELTGASLVHAAAVAYEVDLWPRWVPLCPQAEVRPRARYNPLPCDNPSQCYNPSPCYRPLTTLPTPNHATDPSRAAPRWQCLARQKPSPCYGPVACHPPPPGASHQVLGSLAPTERVTWLQFDLPMMRRGALLHWSLADNLMERQVAAITTLLLSLDAGTSCDCELLVLLAGSCTSCLLPPRAAQQARMHTRIHADVCMHGRRPCCCWGSRSRSSPSSSGRRVRRA